MTSSAFNSLPLWKLTPFLILMTHTVAVSSPGVTDSARHISMPPSLDCLVRASKTLNWLAMLMPRSPDGRCGSIGPSPAWPCVPIVSFPPLAGVWAAVAWLASPPTALNAARPTAPLRKLLLRISNVMKIPLAWISPPG